jgi:hypothetical protein
MRGFLRIGLVLFVLLLAPAGPVKAATIVAGQFTVPVSLTQSVELFPGTPFNPGPTSLTLTAEASGFLTVTYDAQVGTMITTSPFVHLTGTFPDPLPPIPYEIFAGTPDLFPSVGVISGIVQDPTDPGFATGDPSSFISGVFLEEAYFKVVVPGATLYSSAAIFTSNLTGLPYPVGTVFTSPARIDLRTSLVGGVVVAQSFNRVLTVTPEPSSALMALVAMPLLVGRWWRARKRSRPETRLSRSV